MFQLLGALRVSARGSSIPTKSLRSFHSSPSSSLRRRAPPCFPRPSVSITLQSHQLRPFSLATLFTRAKPTPTPSPAIVANIARIEAEANSAPHDVTKQLALFQALVDTKAKAGYDLLVTRWERMCEFVSPSPRNDMSDSERNYTIGRALPTPALGCGVPAVLHLPRQHRSRSIHQPGRPETRVPPRIYRRSAIIHR